MGGMNQAITFKFDTVEERFIGWLNELPNDIFILTTVYAGQELIGIDLEFQVFGVFPGDPFVAHFALPPDVSHVTDEVDDNDPWEPLFMELAKIPMAQF